MRRPALYLVRIEVPELNEFEQFLIGKLTNAEGVASLGSSIPILRVNENSAQLE